MLSLTPTRAPERGAVWPAAVEREGLTAAREPLLRALSAEPPRRIVDLGISAADPLDLAGVFPDTTLRAGELPTRSSHRPSWGGWPDLVWCPYRLSDRSVEPAVALAGLWRGLPPGGRIAIVDLLTVRSPGIARTLERQLARVADPRLFDALLAAFTPIRADIIDHPGGLTSLVFVGRRPERGSPS